MKTMTIRLTFILLLIGLISSCRPKETETRTGSSNTSALICEVYYRQSTAQSLEAAPQITLGEGNAQETLPFVDMSFETRLRDDQFEGRALYIAVTNLDTGDEISRQLFQFDPQNPPENQFIGGHGFTGLNYVFHPDSSAEMQYFCSIKSD